MVVKKKTKARDNVLTRGNEKGDGASCGRGKSCGGCFGGIYGLGFIGAVVYYTSMATGFWVGVLGVLKALVWPAFLVFEALKFLAA